MTSIRKISKHGGESWWCGPCLHREDGPAVICANGDREWWLNGELHREDGPAVIKANSDHYWYLNHNLYAFDDYVQELQLDDVQKAELILEYGL